MKLLSLLGAALLCSLLPACEAIEAEHDSNTPIPPARPNPFGDNFGNSSADPQVIGRPAAGTL